MSNKTRFVEVSLEIGMDAIQVQKRPSNSPPTAESKFVDEEESDYDYAAPSKKFLLAEILPDPGCYNLLHL